VGAADRCTAGDEPPPAKRARGDSRTDLHNSTRAGGDAAELHRVASHVTVAIENDEERDLQKYLTAVGVTVAMPGAASTAFAQKTSTQSVIVTNNVASPVPTVAQGTTRAAGTA
jgi:hypothetical protein